MVLAFHVVASGSWDMAPATTFFANGYRGVVIFFVLSGFLVFRPFLSGPVSTRGYLVRRLARVLPAYLVALAGITLISGDRGFADHPLQFLLLLQNYDPTLFQGFMPTSWTLVLEMTFYVLLPVFALAFLAISGDHFGRGMAVLLTLGTVSMLYHVSAELRTDLAPGSNSLSFPAMIWAFVPGMMAAWLMTRRPHLTRHVARGPVAAVAALLALWGWVGGGSLVAGISADVCLVAGAALAIPWLTRPRVTDEPSTIRRLAWFGVVVSYPFYLWHTAVLDSVRDAGISGPLAFVTTFGVVAVIGVASFRLIESPAIHWSRDPSVPAWIPWPRGLRLRDGAVPAETPVG